MSFISLVSVSSQFYPATLSFGVLSLLCFLFLFIVSLLVKFLSVCVVTCDFHFSAPDYHKCPHPSGNTCEWGVGGMDGLRMKMVYLMKMHAENALKSVVSQTYRYLTTDIGIITKRLVFFCTSLALFFMQLCQDHQPESY